MSISPHHYRDVLNDAQALIDEINAYLQGKTTDGLIIPIWFSDTIDAMIKQCSEGIGRLGVLHEGLGKHSRKRDEYMDGINDLRKCQMELEDLRKAIAKLHLKNE